MLFEYKHPCSLWSVRDPYGHELALYKNKDTAYEVARAANSIFKNYVDAVEFDGKVMSGYTAVTGGHSWTVERVWTYAKEHSLWN